MIAALAGAALLGALLASPLLLARAPLAPAAGATLAVAALVLRAAITVALAAICVLYLPTTGAFKLVTNWCLHSALPAIADTVDLTGHEIGDVAVALPLLVLASSLAWALLGVWRAARAVSAWLRRRALGSGPADSILVDHDAVVLVAAGLRDPRVVVSAGAIRLLDTDELRAGLEHERGHIAHRHRVVTLGAGILHALSRPLPGGHGTFDVLRYHLERDADEYSARRTGDRLSLAGAICKAALVPPPSKAFAPASLADGPVSRRVDVLLDGEPVHSRILAALTYGLAAGSALAAVAALVGAAGFVAAGLH